MYLTQKEIGVEKSQTQLDCLCLESTDFYYLYFSLLFLESGDAQNIQWNILFTTTLINFCGLDFKNPFFEIKYDVMRVCMGYTPPLKHDIG